LYRAKAFTIFFYYAMDSHQVHIEASPVYLRQQSNPEKGIYYFAYTITVTNFGTIATQIISRHWTITDEHGNSEEVAGLGVMGQQPLLEPDHIFEYTSGTRLGTATGLMRGLLFFVSEEGHRFEAAIPDLVLDVNGPQLPIIESSRTLH
jgi:ApaG protein